MTIIEKIKKAIEKERPNTEVKVVEILEKKDDTHYWVRWSGVSHSSSLGDMVTSYQWMKSQLRSK